jgi:hypothetical protein
MFTAFFDLKKARFRDRFVTRNSSYVLLNGYLFVTKKAKTVKKHQ